MSSQHEGVYSLKSQPKEWAGVGSNVRPQDGLYLATITIFSEIALHRITWMVIFICIWTAIL